MLDEAGGALVDGACKWQAFERMLLACSLVLADCQP
jgi:ABC-type maltose transport system permease subunit